MPSLEPSLIYTRKLQFYREGESPKHLRDVLGIVNGMEPDWNREPLHGLIEAHGLQPEWQAALAAD